MRRLGRNLRQRQPSQAKTIAQKVAAILRKYGTDAHVYLPGIGVINGLTAGNYLDSAGTTAATVDNPVGLVLDAANSQLGSERVRNGSFSTDTDWVKGAGWTISGGTANAVTSSTDLYQTGQYPVGFYQLEFTVSNYSAGSLRVAVGSTLAISGVAANGTYRVYVKTVALELIYLTGTGFTGSVDNVSVKEVTGIHALQATTANKPTLRRGAVNLLTYSEQFDNAAWPKVGATVNSNVSISPDGTTTADKLVEDSSLGSHVLNRSSAIAGSPNVFSVYAKAGERTQIALQLGASAVYFNLSTGTIVSGAGGAISIAANGFYRCSISGTPSNGNSLIYLASSGAVSYQGDGTSGVYIRGAQLQTGSVATDYIPTTTAPASSLTGNYHWTFDGSNDSLALGSVPFQMADDHCVIAGFKPSALVDQTVFGIRNNAAITQYVCTIFAFGSGVLQAIWKDDASAESRAASTYTVGTNIVVAARKVSNAKILRTNGVTRDTNSTALGTTTVTGASIGASPTGPNTAFVQGSIYPVIAIKGTVTDADLLILEKFVGVLSGVQI